MSRFKPVKEPVYTDGKASMTLLRHYNACPRSGYLYLKYKGEASTPEMARGSALHAILERSIQACIAQGEVTVPPEVVKAIANEVLREYTVPVEEHDYIRESAYRWAEQTAVDPSRVLALESLFVIDVDGFKVRCRIDYAEQLDDSTIAVKDWKSSRAAPAYEEISRRRPDGSPMAKAFQLVLYGLAIKYGHPVREEPCPNGCNDGIVQHVLGMEDVEEERCRRCEGRGIVESVEPFAVGGAASEVRLSYVFPGIEDREGRMLDRTVTLTALELGEYMESLRALVARLRASEASGQWDAQVSDGGCSECPARSECPIPEELRIASRIETVEQAAEAMEVVDRLDDVVGDTKKAVKAFMKANETDVRFGLDKVYGPTYQEAVRIKDKEGLFAALASGERVDRSQFEQVVKSTPFRVRTLTADEQAEGSNRE